MLLRYRTLKGKCDSQGIEWVAGAYKSQRVYTYPPANVRECIRVGARDSRKRYDLRGRPDTAILPHDHAFCIRCAHACVSRSAEHPVTGIRL